VLTLDQIGISEADWNQMPAAGRVAITFLLKTTLSQMNHPKSGAQGDQGENLDVYRAWEYSGW